jgi:hypothetical protein
MKEDLVAVNPDMSFWAQRMTFVRFLSTSELIKGYLA